MATSKQKPTTLKRKASRKRRNPGKPKPQKHNNQNDGPFPFMNLPPELRNIVYAEAAKDNVAVIEKSTFTDNSALSQVSAQIHNEYMPILALNAKAIQTTVLDFDFRHVVTFINRLSAAELNALPSINKSDTRPIDISLRFNPFEAFHDYHLGRWLKRAGSPTKKGTMLYFRYSLCVPEGQTATWSRFGPMWISHRWHQMLDDFAKVAKDGRPREEALKMRTAFRNPQGQ